MVAVEIAPGSVAQFHSYKNKFAPIIAGVAQTECFPINFEFCGGGMGDYICWTPALQWMIKNCPWVYGRIWTPAYFIEFVRHFFEDVPNWKINLIEKFKTEAEPKTLCRGLGSAPNQLLNATGCNLLRQGFANFVNLDRIPDGTMYPELKIDDSRLPKVLKRLDRPWIVFTPGGTTQARFVPARYWNPLIAFVKELGFMPVFLGKTQLQDVHRAYFDDEVHWNEGIDLREKTTLLEAAAVMKFSAATLGLDNGLLHLAACTDAPIIFAYNIADPVDRRPIRNSGKYIELTVPESELECIGCQTKYKLLYTHNFKNCIRKDVKCIDLLFKNEGELWKKAIEEITK